MENLKLNQYVDQLEEELRIKRKELSEESLKFRKLKKELEELELIISIVEFDVGCIKDVYSSIFKSLGG